MDLLRLSQALQHDAVTIVFLNVLLKQLGLPLPAVPTLLLAGLCKLSINPASCVSQTEARFMRWGISSLVVAKFIPGFATVAPPIAGALRLHEWGFLLAAGIGAGLWAGLPLGAGWLLKDAVQAVIAALDQHTGAGLLFVSLLVGSWVGWKLWRRYQFRRHSAIGHITANELIAALKTDERPLVLDLRGAAMMGEEGPISGTTVARIGNLRAAVGDWPKNQPIVTVYGCPQDAGAIQAARDLLNDGFTSVRPLRGGYDAWVTAIAPGAPLGG